MYKKILIPLDNSSTDNAILEHIKPLIKLTNAEVILVHVADGFASRLQNELNLADSQELTEDQAYLDNIRKTMTAAGYKTRAILAQGKDAGEALLAVANQEGCDLIAMATHGHTFVKDVILGSVADYLRHSTDIPILMIRSIEKK
jgi:nucleotide-binding universal stress UspA family protein